MVDVVIKFKPLTIRDAPSVGNTVSILEKKLYKAVLDGFVIIDEAYELKSESEGSK